MRWTGHAAAATYQPFLILAVVASPFCISNKAFSLAACPPGPLSFKRSSLTESHSSIKSHRREHAPIASPAAAILNLHTFTS